MSKEQTSSVEIINHGNQVVNLLSGVSERTQLVGSCRRGDPRRKEIDIICLPYKVAVHDLFGDAQEYVFVSEWYKTLSSLGVIKKQGERFTQIEEDNGFVLDIFTPQEEDYWRQLAIRTGSNDFVKHIIAKAWRAKGFCGTRDGLRRMEDCQEVKKEGRTDYWKVISKNPILHPHWNSEEDFFKYIGLDYIKPYLREVESVRQAKRLFNELFKP